MFQEEEQGGMKRRGSGVFKDPGARGEGDRRRVSKDREKAEGGREGRKEGRMRKVVR